MIKILEKITILMLLIILFIQAVSDAKTMKIYYWLSIFGIISGGAVCIFLNDIIDSVYILAAVMIVFFSKMMGAYTWGDAKLFFIAIETVALHRENMDILLIFLFLNVIAIVIFSIYVLVLKLIKKEKGRKKYPYAPAIFMATFISIFFKNL